MKKLMKAIAFATVMCMLLSVSAFAEEVVTNPKATLDPNADYNLTVEVTASGTEQVALLVLKAGTELSAASDTTIYYINQDAATEGKATFDVVLNKATLGNETKVDVYAGYASNGTNPAVSVKGVDVVNAAALAINLNQAIELVPDVTQWDKLTDEQKNELVKTDSDIGGLAIADVTIVNDAGAEFTHIGWEFVNTEDGVEDARRVQIALADYGLSALKGNVKFAIAFTNGSKTRESFVKVSDDGDDTNDTKAYIYFKQDKVAEPHKAVVK